jgi:predicted enzyme related to lactoylglutathione lyase
MVRSIIGLAIMLGVGFTACTRQNNSDSQTQKVDTTVNKITGGMKNLISIVEIPTTDFPRAIAFYQVILNIKIEEVEMEGVKMGLFPNSGEGVFVQLINGSEYKPSADGTIVYLNGGDDLQKIADKIMANGGKILVPKTQIGPEMGFFAIFTDTEGNKLGLQSYH